MEEIYEPDATFNFDKLVLTSPASILGGNYFIKFQVSGNPLYIQSPKCTTKQGIIKSGKKMYCDLLMSNEHEPFIQWMENLENFSQEAIFKNREKWFETELEKHDIENSFSSPVKTYKSGKFYTTRTNIPIRLGKCSLKIYDENENDVNIEMIKDTTNIIAIMEVQGIKCSARSFQIEIELKQIMVLKPSNLFEKCIIKSIPIIMNDLPLVETLIDNSVYLETIQPESKKEDIQFDIVIEPKPGNITMEIQDQLVENAILPLANHSLSNHSLTNHSLANHSLANHSINDLTEVEFSLEELPINDTVQLKTRNDVYYQMYKEAKKKAKMARDLALSSYLEAKQIKNTYMLDEIDDESDLDEDEMNFNKE